VVPGAGVELLASTAPRVDRTDELRFYPPGLPAEEATSVATFAFVAAPRAEPQPSPSLASTPLLAPSAPGEPGSDLLGSLVSGELTTARVAAAAFVSFLLGVVHALSPGHGKTLVAATLIGSRGSLRHAVALGLTVAVTHSLGVLLLGFVVLGGSDLLLPQQLTLALSLAAALLVVVLGLDLVRRAIRRPLNLSAHAHPLAHGHDHGPADWTDHHRDARAPTDAAAAADQPAGFRLSAGYTISIGIVGGLVPSASALIVLLMAVTLDRLALGLLLVTAYGLGIALLLAALGAAVVALRGRARRHRLPGGRSFRRLMTVLPLASALAVVAVGVVLTVQVLNAL
jgi:nickel/cobalt exporter